MENFYFQQAIQAAGQQNQQNQGDPNGTAISNPTFNAVLGAAATASQQGVMAHPTAVHSFENFMGSSMGVPNTASIPQSQLMAAAPFLFNTTTMPSLASHFNPSVFPQASFPASYCISGFPQASFPASTLQGMQGSILQSGTNPFSNVIVGMNAAAPNQPLTFPTANNDDNGVAANTQIKGQVQLQPAVISSNAITPSAAQRKPPNVKPSIPSSIARFWSIPGPGTPDNEDQPYCDYSKVPDDAAFHRDVGNGKGKSGGGANFPSKLHEILSRKDIADIISWSPHGRSWRVYKPKAFEENVIPHYFRHSKYNSFTRQVNGWGFRRITQGPDHNAYYHEFFLRGLPHLCKKMRRATSSVRVRGDCAGHVEPDFYRMSELIPLAVNDIKEEIQDGNIPKEKNHIRIDYPDNSAQKLDCPTSLNRNGYLNHVEPKIEAIPTPSNAFTPKTGYENIATNPCYLQQDMANVVATNPLLAQQALWSNLSSLQDAHQQHSALASLGASMPYVSVPGSAVQQLNALNTSNLPALNAQNYSLFFPPNRRV